MCMFTSILTVIVIVNKSICNLLKVIRRWIVQLSNNLRYWRARLSLASKIFTFLLFGFSSTLKKVVLVNILIKSYLGYLPFEKLDRVTSYRFRENNRVNTFHGDNLVVFWRFRASHTSHYVLQHEPSCWLILLFTI